VVRIGILGTASVARLFLGANLQHVRFTAVASRDGARAAGFAHEHGIQRWFASYDDLLADSDIDAVYIPLPHHLHTEYSIRAAEAGKHVLVEKPAALSAADFERMRVASGKSGVVLMEAMMYRFKKIHRQVRQLIREGAIGPIRHLDFSWCFPLKSLQRSAFRLDPPAGGALNDVGVYGADLLHFLLDTSPQVLTGTIWRAAPGGVDLFTQALCTSGESTATITCGYLLDANYYVVGGEEGSIHVPGSVSGRVTENTLRIHRTNGDTWEEQIFGAENAYHAVADHFGEVIERGIAPLVRPEETLANLKLLEEIRRLAGERILEEGGSRAAPSSTPGPQP
jgi:xylose dehydrogenase (NAD/NADP)